MHLHNTHEIHVDMPRPFKAGNSSDVMLIMVNAGLYLSLAYGTKLFTGVGL